jgi:hypothetical protein
MLPPDLAQTSVFFQSRTDAIIAILFSFYFLLLHIKPVSEATLKTIIKNGYMKIVNVALLVSYPRHHFCRGLPRKLLRQVKQRVCRSFHW